MAADIAQVDSLADSRLGVCYEHLSSRFAVGYSHLQDKIWVEISPMANQATEQTRYFPSLSRSWVERRKQRDGF